VMSSKHVCILSLILLGILMLASWEAVGISAQTGVWTEPINISNNPTGSWLPDLAIDSTGNVHVVWCETAREKTGELRETIYYSVRRDDEWSVPNDLVPIGLDINRNALAIDSANNLYLTFRYKVYGGIGINFMKASASDAESAAAWSTMRRVDARSNAYMSDLAVDSQGVLHLVFDDGGDAESEVCPGCADIYYRHSTDRGQTWSYPVNLYRSPIGSAREQIEIDSNDTIHVAWDEGWDRVSGRGEPIASAYTFSIDGGKTWAPITSVSYPESTVAQLTVGSNGQGGVMLVWRATSRDEIFYMWSLESGRAWSPPAVIPGILARPWSTPFDMYDMATDSGGHIHLVVVGRLSPEEDRLGVYHLEWNGTSWSPPTAIYRGAGFPEYPKIVISEGNKLHVAWFTREDLWEGGNREVWYSSSQSASPAQTPVPTPTSTPTPTATLVPTATPTATPYPTLAPGESALPDGLYTESDDLLRLLIGLAPVLILVTVILAIRFGWLRRSPGR
jgi:hypothetical protein